MRWLWFGALVILGVGLACCGAESQNLSPAFGDAEGLGDAGGCAQRERARPICISAMTQRCQSQMGDCEATCESRSLPGSSEKGPMLRGDIEAASCRDRCRYGFSPCTRILVARCPTACNPEEWQSEAQQQAAPVAPSEAAAPEIWPGQGDGADGAPPPTDVRGPLLPGDAASE